MTTQLYAGNPDESGATQPLMEGLSENASGADNQQGRTNGEVLNGRKTFVEIGYCGNPECLIIQQAKKECANEDCPQKENGTHFHCKKCGELL
jgi:hypothetical protein